MGYLNWSTEIKLNENDNRIYCNPSVNSMKPTRLRLGSDEVAGFMLIFIKSPSSKNNMFRYFSTKFRYKKPQEVSEQSPCIATSVAGTPTIGSSRGCKYCGGGGNGCCNKTPVCQIWLVSLSNKIQMLHIDITQS